MTLAQATQEYQVALEKVREFKHAPLWSIEDQYEAAQEDLDKATKALNQAWMRHVVYG